MRWFDVNAATVNGQSISLHSLIQRARIRSQTQFIDDAINAVLVQEAAAQCGIEVSRDEIQVAANAFREKHRLLKAQDAIQWLEDRGLTVTDWQQSLAEDTLIKKLKHVLFEPKADSYFAEHKLEFDTAKVSRIAVANEGLASELLLQIREEGAVFEDVARKYSIDKQTKDFGGYVGLVTRKDLGPAPSSAVFGGVPGSVYGPFKVGKEHRILRLISLHPATLDDETRAKVIERMFARWLEDTRAKANIEIDLFESVPAVVEA
jgi:parvulin-like peptidyl-prolyl isomerase